MLKIAITSLILGFIGMTSSYANAQQTTNSTIPKAIFDGYWAMTDKILDHYGVIKFTRTKTGIRGENLRFICHNNGHYKLIHKEITPITIEDNKLIILKDNQAWSSLQILAIEPKKVLLIKQELLQESGKQLSPQGLEFSYIHRKTAKPLCP